MKKCLFLLLTLPALVFCSSPEKKRFAALDQAIERRSFHVAEHARIQDSLRQCCARAGTQEEQWEAMYELEKRYFYNDIDSCYAAVMDMKRLEGSDERQRQITASCHANILYKMDSTGTALHVLKQIDTVAMDPEARGIYCFAAYHIYGELMDTAPEYRDKRRDIARSWWHSDSTRIESAFYYNEVLRQDGMLEDAIPRLDACVLKSPNDTTKAYYFLAKEYLSQGDMDLAVKYFTLSAECDMRLAVKAYNALYELARILFRKGDIERADRYMRITLQDAYSSHYAARYEDVILSELEVMNALLKQQQQKKRAYLTTSFTVALLLVVAVIFLLLLSRYSTRLSISRQKLSEASKIKEKFLAMYMEKCVDYLNKVDEYRSSLRRTVRQDGPEAVIAMLRRPSFADGEFDGLLSYFDSAFLSIFPDFVERVNEHMQEPYRLEMPAKGELSTELRILALIRMGISRRLKIAKVLNMSVATVYSYHSTLKKHSLHPGGEFDQVIANL